MSVPMLKKSAPAVMGGGLKRPQRKVQPEKPKGDSSRKKEKKGKKGSTTTDAAGLIVAVKAVLKSQKRDDTEVQLLGDPELLPDVVEWIPTGFPNLDAILGGGLAVGRTSEVFGPEGSGKSALLHAAIAALHAAHPKSIAMLHDYEMALDKPKLLKLRIDPKRLIVTTPADMEEGWDMIFAALNRLKEHWPEAPVLFGWDSIAASQTRREAESDSAADVSVGEQARIMSRNCRKAMRLIARCRAHLMWVNQQRNAIGKRSFVPEKTTPGGEAAKYYSSQRVSTWAKQIKEGDRATGYLVSCYTKKCRLCPPHQKAAFVLDFKEGPSPDLTAFHVLKDAKIIRSRGQMYLAPWSQRKFRRLDWLRLCDEVPEWRSKAMDSLARVEELKALRAKQAGDSLDDDDDDDLDDDE